MKNLLSTVEILAHGQETDLVSERLELVAAVLVHNALRALPELTDRRIVPPLPHVPVLAVLSS